MSFYYRNNSKFLDTTVYYTKYIGVLVYRAILNGKSQHAISLVILTQVIEINFSIIA